MISAQAEANGIDAIVTETPVNTNIQERNLLEEYSYGDFKQPDAQVERLKGIVKLHRIPLAVLDRYPNLFTSTELLADKNTFFLNLLWSSQFGSQSSFSKEVLARLRHGK